MRGASSRNTVLVALLVTIAPGVAGAQSSTDELETSSDGERSTLTVEEVLASIQDRYPPLLAGLIERDLRAGQLRAARGTYDLELFGKVKGTPEGYYEYTTLEAGARQFLGLWGSSVYGGYRLTTGDSLPGYYTQRTQGDGEVAVGLTVPLLKNGPLDAERAGVARAELEARAAEPMVARQRLDFLRAGSVAYYKWLAAGRKLQLSRELLRLANDRTAGLTQQVEDGLLADIVLVDNRQLVLSRELDVVEAERSFLGASLALSLFLRSADGRPTVPGEDRLPPSFPGSNAELVPPDGGEEAGLEEALARRPELVQLGLELEAAEVEVRLARTGLLPTLDANLELARNYGEDLYPDRSATDVRAELSFKLPLQRRSASGKEQAAQAKLRQARQKLAFARDKILAEIRDTRAALEAARLRIERADLNVDLAERLRDAEREQFQAGASDLLSVQIREQKAFDAQVKAVDAQLDLFTAVADLRAALAVGLDAPSVPPGPGDQGGDA